MNEPRNRISNVSSKNDKLEWLVILKFNSEPPDEVLQWLINKLTAPLQLADLTLHVDKILSNNDKLEYLKIGLTTKALLILAELMQLKKKCRLDSSVMNFSLDNLDLFENAENLATFLTSSEKVRIIWQQIESIKYLELDVLSDKVKQWLPSFVPNQAIFSRCQSKQLLTYFPSHDPESLKLLETNWIKTFMKNQPLDEIRDYFGEAIAMYFGFLGSYTRHLILPAGCGIIIALVSMISEFDWSLVPFFCLFNVVWTTVFSEVWKRKSIVYAYRWGTLDATANEVRWPQYEAVRRSGFLQNFPFKFYLLSVPIVLLCLILCTLAMLFYFLVDAWLASMDVGLVLSFMPTIVYGGFVCVSDWAYRKLALKLNNFENHRLQSSYDNHFIGKLVSFNFVNYFLSLFYVAFYLQDFDLLRKNLATLLITWQIIQQLQETLLPYSLYKMSKKKCLQAASSCESVTGEDATDARDVLKQCAKFEYTSTLDDYMELFLQFGYCFLFSAVFPLAALCCIINNIIEVKSDAFRLCKIYRRPFSFPAENIGAWQLAFDFLSYSAVITNCALLSLTPEFLKFNSDTPTYILIVVAAEHIVLAVKVIVSRLIPNRPDWLKKKIVEQDDLAKQTWLKKRQNEITRFAFKLENILKE